MKRKHRDSKPEEPLTISIRCTCIGLYLLKHGNANNIYLILIMDKSPPRRHFYSLLLDENSSILISPLRLYEITMVYDFETNGEFGIDEFPCYKLHSIQKINYERSRLKENQDDELVLNTRLKNVLKTTVYLYSYTKEHESIAPEEIHELLNQSQSNIIRGIFNKSKIPIIYCYDRNSRDYKIIIILSKLFALAPNKNNKNKKLKIDDDSSITLRTLFNKLETKSKNLSNTIKIMFKEEKSSPSNSYTIVFNDEEDEDTEQSGPIKTIDEIKEIVQNYSNSLYNLYFYRFEHTEFSTRLRLSVTGLDIINKHNY